MIHFINNMAFRDYGYDGQHYESDDRAIHIQPKLAKQLFNLKRHLRPGSRKILEFEVNVKEVK